MLHVIFELSLILVTVVCGIFLPLSFALLVSLHKVAGVASPIAPLILPFPVGLTVDVVTLECVSVCEEVAALAMLQRIEPLPFIAVSIDPTMHTMALYVPVVPLATVAIAKFSFPDPEALLDSLVPLSLVDLSILPGVETLAISLVLLVESHIRRTIRKYLVASASALVVSPLSLVESTVLIHENPQTMPQLTLVKAAHVKGCFAALNIEIWLFVQCFKIK